MNDEQFKMEQIKKLTEIHGEMKGMHERVKTIDDYFRNGGFRQQLKENIGDKIATLASSDSKKTLLLYFSIGIIGTCVGIILKLVYFAQ